MEEILKEFGLSDNEVKIYLALLKLGTSTANRVSEITGIKRSTTYDNLHLLFNKGIVSSFMKSEVTYFEAADPEKIIHLLEEKKKRIESIIPRLNKLKETAAEKTGVSYFEGKKGVLTVLNDIIDVKKELWFYGSRKEATVALAHYPDDFVKKRVENKIKLRAVISLEDKGDPFLSDKKVSKLSDVKYLNLDKMPANVFIYGDRVAFMTSATNPVGIIIKNKEVLEQQKRIFEILWKQAKR